MPAWLIYALFSMGFAGLTSVIAKAGMDRINADLGLAVRTAAVFVLVIFNLGAWGGWREAGALTPRSIAILCGSGLTTTLSWVCYYRAMKLGTVSWVATIDKGSIVITLLLSALLLKEPLTPRLLAGAGLILSGLLVLVWK